jgi:cephalosporin hydroxylase
MDANVQDIYSREGFEELTQLWLKAGWQLKVPYTYSWLGFPILQIPDDMVRMQEVIVASRPDLIVETGVAHGGSVVFYASLCALMGHGRVLGIEKGLRCRRQVEACLVADRISLLEGDSVATDIVANAASMAAGKRTMVILDSCHSRAHVAAELEAYAPLVSKGMYIVVTDGNMGDLADVPRGTPAWKEDNPQTAALEFVSRHPEFVIEQPAWPYNESELHQNITYWPNAWLRRK